MVETTNVEPTNAADGSRGSGDGRIVVGVDGSQNSKAALRWAMDEANVTGRAVDVVIAWDTPSSYGFTYGMAASMYDAGSYEDLAKKVADSVLVEARDSEVGKAVPITSRVVEGHPAQTLLDAAKGADLLVLGRRGHGTLTGLLLGSVSDHCLRHAPCPVVVVTH